MLHAEMSGAPSVTLNPKPGPFDILLIEDSITLRGLIRKALERIFPTATVREAGDGREAIRELIQGSVRLIVTDLQMPRMDGKDFIRRLRQNPLLQDKPVVVLSSEDPACLKELLDSDPALRFIPKPARPGALEGAARELLRLPA